jgi:ABC-2 type transport system permease protein
MFASNLFSGTVFWRELRANLKPLLIWSVALVLLVISGMTKYTALSSAGAGGASLTELLKQMPDTLRALLGFGHLDVTSLLGYLVMLMLYFELTLALHAALLGAGILSKEERLHTAEFLFAKPVTRTAVTTAKFAAALVQLVVLNLLTLATTLAVLPAYHQGPDISAQVLNLFASVAFVQVVFLTLGFALAALLRDPRRAGAWTSAVVVVAYVLDRLAPLSPGLAALDTVSPFSWFAFESLASGRGLGAGPMVVAALSAVALAGFALWNFPRRDLRV